MNFFLMFKNGVKNPKKITFLENDFYEVGLTGIKQAAQNKEINLFLARLKDRYSFEVLLSPVEQIKSYLLNEKEDCLTEGDIEDLVEDKIDLRGKPLLNGDIQLIGTGLNIETLKKTIKETCEKQIEQVKRIRKMLNDLTYLSD